MEAFGVNHGLSPKALFELNLILEEVVTNVIIHAYEDDQRHEIIVKATAEHGELIFEVEDDGRPFNPLQVPSPDLKRPLEEREVGGLGVHIVRELTGSLEYERKGERNRLILRKKSDGN